MRILSLSSKPSPARTEKFPPPLLRFLRNNKSSRSRRGPSKAAPLFFKKKRKSLPSSSSGIETTQEPSSPKVTCIGQVRVRRSKNRSKAKNGSKRPPNPAKYTNCNLCCWSRKPRLCKLNSFTGNRKCDWKWKWIWKWICCDCCGVKVRSAGSSIDCSSARFEESEKQPPETQEQRLKREFERRFLEDDNDDVYEKGRRSSTSDMATTMSSISPPKNALLLTRSRSASLACRFWNEEEEEEVGNSRRNRCLVEEDISEMAKSTPNNPVLTRCGSSSMAVRFCDEEEKKLKLMKRLDEDDNDNGVHQTGRRSSTSDIGRHSNEDNVYQIRRKSSASEMRNTTESVNSRIFGCFGEDDSNQRRRKSSASEMSTPTERVNSRIIGYFGEDDSNQTRRKSLASPKTAILLTRCKSSSLACRFWGEEGEEVRNTRRMEHFDEEGEFEVEGRRSCASEVGTSGTVVGPPRNALLLMKCKASSLASRMWLDKRDSVCESRVSHFSADSRTSMEVSDAAEVGEVEEQCGDFDMIAVKNEGEFVNEDGKNEDGNLLLRNREVKLRRCKSEPRRGVLETFDPHRRSSNVN